MTTEHMEEREMEKLGDLRQQRDHALLSLDEGRIRAYYRAAGVPTPSDPEIFWLSVHKARTALRTLPLAERIASKAWLHARGSASLDDGDIPEQGVAGHE